MVVGRPHADEKVSQGMCPLEEDVQIQRDGLLDVGTDPLLWRERYPQGSTPLCAVDHLIL